MKIFNTLSNQKEELELLNKQNIKLFVCGPTVYDYIHIGNARTYLIFDAFARYLRAVGYKVYYLQNITDIDDKIISRAKESGMNVKQIARKFEKEYLLDEKSLGINSVTKHIRATAHIKEIVKQIQTLIEKNYAYKIENDGYYFDITKFADYGKLSKRTVLQAEDSVSRIDESVGKKNRGDFALWKFYKDGEPFWKTALGNGRPGWHIEDTAITEKFFGPQYDIHGAAIDLIFPHHEAELAQQEAASEKKPFVKIWMHSGFLNSKGNKMSKSNGAFLTVKDFLKTNDPNILRLISLNHHYRSPIEYSDELVFQTKEQWSNLLQFLAKLNIKKSNSKSSLSNKPINQIREDILFTKNDFNESLQNDFNTPKAIASLHLLINKYQAKVFTINREDGKNLAKFITNHLKLLGFKTKLPEIPSKVIKLGVRRELFRGNKQFAKSDLLRKELDGLGYTVDDTPFGPLLWPK